MLLRDKTLENSGERSDLVLWDGPGHAKMVLGPPLSCVMLMTSLHELALWTIIFQTGGATWLVVSHRRWRCVGRIDSSS